MTLLTILNIVVINVAMWFGVSYFWSFWTHKVFKPWAWLEQKKRKMINTDVEKTERTYKDRVRYYTYFFAMQQSEEKEVQGEIVMMGVEDIDLVRLLREQYPQREMRVCGPMEASTYTIRRENCQGEVTEEVVPIDYAEEAEVRKLMPETDVKSHVYKGAVTDVLKDLKAPVALSLIDTVDYEDVMACMRTTYPLMPKGGIMIVHSYNHDWEGIKRAVDDFGRTIAEGFLPVADMYGSVAMVKS